MFKRIISVLMVSAMAPGFAQERRALTVEECISLGLENSKSLHASQMQVQSSEAQASEVSASRLPSLKLAGGYTRLSEVSPFAVTLPTPTGSNTLTVSPSILNNFAVRASLAQPLFTGFRLESAQKMAEYHSLATREDYSKDRIDLVYEIKNAYWSLYKAFEVQKFVDENVDQVKAHLVDAQNLMEQGLATRNDVLKIQVQLSDAGLRQIDARNAVQIAMINLNNLTGVPLNTTVELATSIHPEQVGTKPFASLDVLVRRAIDNRPDVKGMRYSVQANEASVKAARSGWLPQVSLVANYYDSRPNSRILPARNEFANTWDVGVNVSLDLWNWETTAHQTAQAQAQLEQTKDALGTMKDDITLEVTQSYLDLQQAKDKIGVAKTGVEQAEENFRITNDKYKEGLASTTDLLDADVALLQARTNYTQALVDYELSEARLQRASGEALQ